MLRTEPMCTANQELSVITGVAWREAHDSYGRRLETRNIEEEVDLGFTVAGPVFGAHQIGCVLQRI